MGRAPCCEKMGVKKGPWTPEEDQILVNYIQQHGHGNWRALPKLAGLSRCGKSCRLRWTNYLRPDIKRGNFSREEEEAIINLHEMLGNRWSAIAARLPGRTDNEIKNVWHTHLKKRLNQNHTTTATSDTRKHFYSSKTEENPEAMNPSPSDYAKSESLDCGPVSPPQCTSSSDTSSGSVTTKVDYEEALLPEADESFWSEVLSAENSEMMEELKAIGGGGSGSGGLQVAVEEPIGGFSLDMYDNEFWYNVFTGAEQIIPDMLEI